MNRYGDMEVLTIDTRGGNARITARHIVTGAIAHLVVPAYEKEWKFTK